MGRQFYLYPIKAIALIKPPDRKWTLLIKRRAMASTVCKVIGYILLVLVFFVHNTVIVQMWMDEGYSRVLHIPSLGEILIWLAMLLYYLPGLGFLAVGQKLE